MCEYFNVAPPVAKYEDGRLTVRQDIVCDIPGFVDRLTDEMRREAEGELETRLHAIGWEHVTHCAGCEQVERRGGCLYCTGALGQVSCVEVMPDDFCSYGFPRGA